jgi:RecA/RadA recombinase
MAKKAKAAGVQEPKNFLLTCVDDDTSIAEDGVSAGESSGYLDTGCYVLNLQLSGTIYGGAPANRITVFAGEEATGKTFLIKSIMKNFIFNEDGQVLYYDSESAQRKKDFEEFGIDPSRVAIADKGTIQEVRSHALQTANRYLELKEADRPALMLVLDSLGNLSSLKEMEDIQAGKDTRDMTKSQLIRGMFRTVNNKIGKARIPWLIANHTYNVVGAYVPTNKQSGGGGIAYNASVCLFLSKTKDRNTDKDVVGNIITSTAHKNRFAKENTRIQFKLSYKDGLDRYYGLLDLAVKYGLSSYSAKGGKYELIAGDGVTFTEKQIYKTPEKFFTKEWLDKFEEIVSPNFRYGEGEAPTDDEDEEEFDDRITDTI